MGISLVFVLTARAGWTRASCSDKESCTALLFNDLGLNLTFALPSLSPHRQQIWVTANWLVLFKLLSCTLLKSARDAPVSRLETTIKYFSSVWTGIVFQLPKKRVLLDDLGMCRPCKVANTPLMSYEWISRRGAGFYWRWAVQECSPALHICIREAVS